MPLETGGFKKGTHITFHNLGNLNGSSGKPKITNTYEVIAQDTQFLLGVINGYTAWRKYVFNPTDKTLYEETCLKEIAQFIEEETKAHKRGTNG